MPGKKAKRDGGTIERPEVLGIVFELEYVAAPGRNLFYEMARRAMKERGMNLLPVHVSKHGIGVPLEVALTAMAKECGKPRSADRRLADDVQRAVASVWAGLPETEVAGFARFLRSAKAAGIRMVALSGLEEAAATDLASRLRFGEHQVMVHPTGLGPTTFAEPGVWRQVAGLLCLPAGRAVALVSTSASCHAAIRAGLRCVAVPDAFTAFQDFSGADMVSEKADEKLVRAVMQLCGKRESS